MQEVQHHDNTARDRQEYKRICHKEEQMTREDLINYKFLKMRVDRKTEDYERDFTRATKITNTIDGMPKAHNKPNYVVEEFIDASMGLITLFNEDLKKQADIERQLKAMNNEKYYTALYLRYIVYATEKNPLEQTASTMNYSYNEMCKINGEALNKFDELDKK